MLVAKIAGGYVEIIRNLPLLLQLLFWYNAVLKALPRLRDSISISGRQLPQQSRLFLAEADFRAGLRGVPIAFCSRRLSARSCSGSGRGAGRWRPDSRRRCSSVGLLLIVGLPLLALALTGFPVDIRLPEMGRFNIRGGIEILPEFAALLFGLSIYTAAFIAEAVRAGIQAVSHGQTEAAYSLGLRPGPTLRLIVIPQAMRVIMPPLTNQYLNLTKNSSLAVAIGYPDLVQVFTGTVLNQTGQAVEVVAITMAVYLTISLVTSGLMNLYNRRIALVER